MSFVRVVEYRWRVLNFPNSGWGKKKASGVGRREGNRRGREGEERKRMMKEEESEGKERRKEGVKRE